MIGIMWSSLLECKQLYRKNTEVEIFRVFHFACHLCKHFDTFFDCDATVCICSICLCLSVSLFLSFCPSSMQLFVSVQFVFVFLSVCLCLSLPPLSLLIPLSFLKFVPPPFLSLFQYVTLSSLFLSSPSFPLTLFFVCLDSSYSVVVIRLPL